MLSSLKIALKQLHHLLSLSLSWFSLIQSQSDLSRTLCKSNKLLRIECDLFSCIPLLHFMTEKKNLHQPSSIVQLFYPCIEANQPAYTNIFLRRSLNSFYPGIQKIK